MLNWIQKSNIIYTKKPKTEYVKLACFDLDYTLIKPKSKNKFAKNKDDWMLMYDNVIDKLQYYATNNYLIVIISNQAGLKTQNLIDEWKEKLQLFVDYIKIKQIMIICSIKNDNFRKPNQNIFDLFFTKYNRKKSFYCGDACGRETDFSDTDVKFALNIGLNFFAPEQIFLNKNIKLPKIQYPIKFGFDEPQLNKTIEQKFKPSKKLEMIILVGMPASGKSYVSKYLNKTYNYLIVNQDIHKTFAKCVKIANEYLNDQQNIIIDATNSNIEIRKKWINIAQKHDYKIRVIKMMTSYELCKHNNGYRSRNDASKRVPDIVYNVYKNKYEDPSIEEGIDKIIEVYPSYPNDPEYFKYYY